MHTRDDTMSCSGQKQRQPKLKRLPRRLLLLPPDNTRFEIKFNKQSDSPLYKFVLLCLIVIFLFQK